MIVVRVATEGRHGWWAVQLAIPSKYAHLLEKYAAYFTLSGWEATDVQLWLNLPGSFVIKPKVRV